MMVSVAVTLADVRRFAVARSLFPPTTLKRAVERLGFVQADPIRAPARAQDLTLRHRVKGYRAGDLERRYHALGIEEDFFINYGFVSRSVHALMHPRVERSGWTPTRRKRAAARARLHPRARRRASPPGRRPLRARHGHQLLGRLVERDDAPAGAHALSRHAAGDSAREGHPHLRGPRAGGAARHHADAARARRRARSTSSSTSTRRCRVSRCRFS